MINIYDVWFSRVNICNNYKLKLLDKYDSSENIWNIEEKDFKKIGLKNNSIKEIMKSKIKLNQDKYIEYMYKNEIRIISFKEKLYPVNLNQINNKPVYIYVRGNINNLYEDNIAIVGTRKASEYGKIVARKFAKEIADRNINIVSGLAIGIDKYSHLGALDSNVGSTIAVLGTGISDYEIYPYENKRVFERILKEGGTIVSEFCLGTKPLKYNFPLRNRIISGLSSKIIVVDATKGSGSFITVDYALDQGKEVYAVPGNITSKVSEGTNYLISEGATLLCNVDELF